MTFISDLMSHPLASEPPTDKMRTENVSTRRSDSSKTYTRRFSDTERVITFVLRAEVRFGGEFPSCTVLFDRRVVDKVLSAVIGRASQITTLDELFHMSSTDEKIPSHFFDVHPGPPECTRFTMKPMKARRKLHHRRPHVAII
ncbi:hypothetical protein PQR37_13235 [Paraburkholderia nemoris]